MEIRRVVESDYLSLCVWWKRHDWTPMPFDRLPSVGYIVPGICAGFVYKSDGWAFFEWIVANPEADKDVRAKGLDLLIDQIIEETRGMIVFTSTKHPGWIKRMEAKGFKTTDEGMTNLLYVGG